MVGVQHDADRGTFVSRDPGRCVCLCVRGDDWLGLPPASRFFMVLLI